MGSRPSPPGKVAPSGEDNLLEKGAAMTLSAPPLRVGGRGNMAHSEKGSTSQHDFGGGQMSISKCLRIVPSPLLLNWLTWVYNLNASLLRSYLEPG